MTQEDKNLLLKDLCGRIPYGVKCISGVDDQTLIIEGHMMVTDRLIFCQIREMRNFEMLNRIKDA